jgi:AhpD family alkylhydroperoxidase
MPGGSLPRSDTEMVILRVAHLRNSAYELAQHSRLARRAGLNQADIERVTRGPNDEGWSPRRRLMLEATDQLIRTHDLSDETWTSLRKHLDEKTSLELVMLVCHYDMLATFIQTLRIAPDV